MTEAKEKRIEVSLEEALESDEFGLSESDRYIIQNESERCDKNMRPSHVTVDVFEDTKKNAVWSLKAPGKKKSDLEDLLKKITRR